MMGSARPSLLSSSDRDLMPLRSFVHCSEGGDGVEVVLEDGPMISETLNQNPNDGSAQCRLSYETGCVPFPAPSGIHLVPSSSSLCCSNHLYVAVQYVFVYTKYTWSTFPLVLFLCSISRFESWISVWKYLDRMFGLPRGEVVPAAWRRLERMTMTAEKAARRDRLGKWPMLRFIVCY